MGKKTGRFFGFLMILGLSCYGLGRFVFPLQVVRLYSEAQVFMSGARSFRTAGAEPVTGYVRDFCDPADPEARGCTCIALIHGLGDSPLTWKNLLRSKSLDWKVPVRLYALQVDREDRFREGDKSDDYRVHNQAHQIAKELKPLCPAFMVVGNSMGGWIASWMAIDQELPITKLILTDTVGLKAASSAFNDFGGEVTIEKLKDFERRAHFKRREIPENVWDHVFEKYKKAHIPDIIGAQTPDDFLDGKLSEIRMPTMIIWGQSDLIAPISGGRLYEKEIKGSRRDHPQCGHMPQKECTVPYIADLNEMIKFGSM